MGIVDPFHWREMFFLLLSVAFLSSSVSGHGGVLWPPIWQDGVGRPIDELTSVAVFSDPKVRDPNNGRKVWSAKSWLTDQAYTGGVGDECKGHEPLGCSGTSSFPRGRLWDLWREPDGLPGL